MKKSVLITLLIIFIITIAGGGYYLFSSMHKNTQIDTSLEEDIVYKQETESVPSWIPANTGGGQPWYEDLMITTSNDGMNFSGDKLFIPHAGVGHLLLTDDNTLIAVFQYFSYVNEEMFDKVAYTISKDYGETWATVKLINIDTPSNSGFMVGPNACDPTLVQLEDGSFRLYFTYETNGDGGPTLYSAKSDTIDGLFEWEGKQLEPNGTILDPAIVYFNNTWHHYTTNHDDFGGDIIRNVHSTSQTGTDFERQEDIEIGMSFLGDVIEVEGGLRFYSGQQSAFSEDGYEWEIDEGQRMEGADPGVAIMPDGSYVAIYTGGEK